MVKWILDRITWDIDVKKKWVILCIWLLHMHCLRQVPIHLRLSALILLMTLPMIFVIRMRLDQVLKIFWSLLKFHIHKRLYCINWLWGHCCVFTHDLDKEDQKEQVLPSMWERRGGVQNLDGRDGNSTALNYASGVDQSFLLLETRPPPLHLQGLSCSNS